MTTFEKVKNLNLKDFVLRNKEIWWLIESLTIEELEELISLDIWSNKDYGISDSISEILSEKKRDFIAKLIKDKLTKEELELFFDVLLFDRDILLELDEKFSQEMQK